MKNLVVLGLVGAFALTSCKTVTSARTAQDQRSEFLQMKGDWQISSVNHDSNFRIKPFDEGADAQCFVGSQWRLIPNNYSGSYTLNGGTGCPSLTRPIKFEVLEGNVFQFKKVADGTKAKQNDVGYTMTLLSQTSDSFSVQQTVPYEGEMVNVVYNFVRTGK